MEVVTGAAIEPRVINIPIDQIHDDGDDMRRTRISARSDAAMTSSIKRRGVLQAIGVRPNGNGYRIVFGRGRLRCARAAGLTEIPADVRDWQDAEIRAVQGAENMQRRAPHPVDVWLTVRDLVDEGYTVAEAAAELGLDDRQALQMERLGRLDDKLLKLCEIEMPDDRYLRVIANAPTKLQRQVASGSRGRLVIRGAGDREMVQWYLIAEACRVQRISRQLAIFDAAAHPKLWEEDLFVPPDVPDAITTRDVAGFMKLQKAALETRVETDRKAKKRVQLAEYDGSKYPAIALPKGWKLQGSHAPQNGWRPKKTESVFVALAPDGRVVEVLAVDVAAQKAADKVKADRQKTADNPTHSRAEEDGEPDAEDPSINGAEREEPDQAEVEAITKAGLDLVAKAKTEALHKALASVSTASKTVAPSILLRLALITFAASNVTLRPHDIDYEDVLARLVSPDGQPIDLNPVELGKLACDGLTRILRIGGPGTYGMNASGDAAEWIGATIDAGAQLPRFDTEEFLKQVRGSVLVDLAEQAGIKSSGTVTALRARLVGQLPNWRPHAAQFGAPGPVRE